MRSMKTDVLIAGAGPTGLVLALWLQCLGVGVRVIDKAAEPGTTSRALAVHARTLELYRQIGIATVSQTRVNYRRSELSQGKAGAVHGGDRLP
jgi:2-polyprenyl-6-methoxyphenol hydroxylase-like FAD-dependent oxidoreductase